MITRLETERLRLRRPVPEDERAYVGHFMSERAKFMGGPMREHIAWMAFAGELAHWELRGWGTFTVTWKDADAPIGLVGPWYPGGWPEREIGRSVLPDAEGKGVAFEAARAAIDHVYQDLGWKTAVSYVDPRNTRSIALAARPGASRDETAPRIDPDDIVFRHPSAEAAR